MAVVLVALEQGYLLGFRPRLQISSTVVLLVTGLFPLIVHRNAKCDGVEWEERVLLEFSGLQSSK